MQTTNLGMAPVQTAMNKRNKIPLNRNIYGSCGFGEVIVHNFKQVEADTDQYLSNETLLYLATILHPTYGHVSMKFWTYFVGMSDLSRNVAAMLGQTNVTRAGELLVPTKVPHLPRNLLSALFLFGSQCSIYEVNYNSANGAREYVHPMLESGADAQAAADFVANVRTLTGDLISSQNGDLNLFGFTSQWIDARVLFDFDWETAGDASHAVGMRIPLSNPDWWSFVTVNDDNGALVRYNDGIDVAPVSVAGADFIIERTFSYTEGGETKYKTFAFCFRMHAFGKRLYKVMKGTEFQEDWTDKSLESLLPLFAVYKGYFDSFGLLLYRNWENTACAKLLSLFDDLNLKDFTFMLVSDTDDTGNLAKISSAGQAFIKELGSMWVTASQDWASMHTKSIGVAPKVDAVSSFDARFLSSSTNSTPAVAAPAHLNIPAGNTENSASLVNQHAIINSIYHGQLDCELLKRLYLQTNRDTLAGKRLEELLRLEGFGKWVDSVKPRFVKFEQLDVDFSKVLASSDTYKDGQGAFLGERGGYGQGYTQGKGYHYHNDEVGYIFTLCAVVPDAGLTNVHNVAYEQIEKLDFFLPEYDALGYEATKIKSVVGSLPFAAAKYSGGKLVSRSNVTDQTFGVAPRSSKFKVVHNVCNGDFARHSVRNNFLSYMMDKVISLGELTQVSFDHDTINDVNYRVIKCYETFAPEHLPLAGEAWRYPTRYPWLGLFTRIFANVGDDSQMWHDLFISESGMIGMYEFINNESDGFFFLSTLRGSEQTHKLPISDSFETKSDGNNGSSDYMISKA